MGRNYKAERSESLIRLTRRLIDTRCTDMEILTEVDRLCRATWDAMHSGWVRWTYYMEVRLGETEYAEWSRNNCKKVAGT